MQALGAVKKLTHRFGPALIGQALNFIAMLLPVAMKEPAMVAYLMFPLALAILISRAGSLSFHSVYLRIPEDQLKLSTAVSAYVTLLAALTTGLVGVVLLFLHPAWAARVLWAVPLTLAVTLYNMFVAIVIREDKADLYSRVRFYYGVINIIATSAFVFFFPVREALIYAAIINYLAGSAMMATGVNNRVWGAIRDIKPRLGQRDTRSYIYQHREATTGSFLADVGFQVQGLVTPLLGPYQEAWAIVLRLFGGFSTLVQQVIAPSFEAVSSRHAREDNRAGYQKSLRIALIVAVVTGVGTAAVQYAAIVWNDHSYLHAAGAITVLSVYAISGMVYGMVNKYPVIAGRQREYMAWSSVRAIVLVAMPFFLNNGPLLYAFCLLSTAFAVVFPLFCSLPKVPAEPSSRE